MLEGSVTYHFLQEVMEGMISLLSRGGYPVYPFLQKGWNDISLIERKSKEIFKNLGRELMQYVTYNKENVPKS